jgi:hypothetical protein
MLPGIWEIAAASDRDIALATIPEKHGLTMRFSAVVLDDTGNAIPLRHCAPVPSGTVAHSAAATVVSWRLAQVGHHREATFGRIDRLGAPPS